MYLIIMDKPGSKSSRTFYRKIDGLIAQGVLQRVQRSNYATSDPRVAREVSKLAKRYGCKVEVFRAEVANMCHEG